MRKRNKIIALLYARVYLSCIQLMISFDTFFFFVCAIQIRAIEKISSFFIINELAIAKFTVIESYGEDVNNIDQKNTIITLNFMINNNKLFFFLSFWINKCKHCYKHVLNTSKSRKKLKQKWIGVNTMIHNYRVQFLVPAQSSKECVYFVCACCYFFLI